jgi:hypothetical protein
MAAAALFCAPSIIVFAIGRLSDMAMLAAGMVYFSGMLLVLWELVRPERPQPETINDQILGKVL